MRPAFYVHDEGGITAMNYELGWIAREPSRDAAADAAAAAYAAERAAQMADLLAALEIAP